MSTTLTTHLTCSSCGSAINLAPSLEAHEAECDICHHRMKVTFNQNHMKSILDECPHCQRRDFYTQKDFNRKIGVILFVLAAILSIWTYGISFIVLYAFDFFLFRRLGNIAICYNCQAVFRNVANIAQIAPFNHEMNDRIVYSGHNFEGKTLDH